MQRKTIIVTSALILAAAAAGCSSKSTAANDDADAGAPAPVATASNDTDASSTAPDAAVETSPAIDAFWTAIHAGDWSTSDQVIANLKAEAAANPTDSVRAEYVGVAEIWRLAEASRDPANQQSIEISVGAASGTDLQTAHGLDPNNFFTTGFLGISTVDYGVYSQSVDTENQGFALIAQAASGSRVFSDFVQAFATEQLPASDARVGAAVTAMWDLFDTCISGTLDRTNPDYTPYFALASAPDAKRFCWNSDKAPHGLEGAFLFMGDLLVKESQTGTATIFYKNAQKSPDYATWLHQSAIEQRLSSDLNARAQAYASTDPTTWPTIGDGSYQCTQCHGKTGL